MVSVDTLASVCMDERAPVAAPIESPTGCECLRATQPTLETALAKISTDTIVQ